QDLAGLLVDDVFGADLADQVVCLDGQRGDAGRLQLFDGGTGELRVATYDDLGPDLDVPRGTLTQEQVELDALRELAALLQGDRLGVVEVVEQLLSAVTQGSQQD